MKFSENRKEGNLRLQKFIQRSFIVQVFPHEYTKKINYIHLYLLIYYKISFIQNKLIL